MDVIKEVNQLKALGGYSWIWNDVRSEDNPSVSMSSLIYWSGAQVPDKGCSLRSSAQNASK